MYKDQVPFEPIPDESIIWRYMSFSKFCRLIQKSSLFFCRSDQFEDPWEYSYPFKNRDPQERLKRTQITGEVSEGLIQNIKKIYEQDEELGRYGVEEAIEMKKLFALNCWHISDFESDAFWKTYGKTDGIAIKSNFSSFKNSFVHKEQDVFIGKVNYIDYQNAFIDTGNIFSPLLYKRKSFEHEKELRAIIHKFDIAGYRKEVLKGGYSTRANMVPTFESEAGEEVSIDVEKLILEVYVSPLAGEWLCDVVKKLLEDYQFNKPVIRSTHLDCPR